MNDFPGRYKYRRRRAVAAILVVAATAFMSACSQRSAETVENVPMSTEAVLQLIENEVK